MQITGQFINNNYLFMYKNITESYNITNRFKSKINCYLNFKIYDEQIMEVDKTSRVVCCKTNLH